MRQTPGRLNRTWLALTGLFMLLLGLTGILLAAGLARQTLAAAGLTLQTAQPRDSVVPEGFQNIFVPPTAALILTVVSIILGVLALAWLLAQIPKRQPASTFRLHGTDGTQGYTTCDPGVIAHAVESEVRQLPGVQDAAALLRGSASQPELNLDIRIDTRADVQHIINQAHTTVATNLETALETPLRKVALLINVSAHRGNDKTVVL